MTFVQYSRVRCLKLLFLKAVCMPTIAFLCTNSARGLHLLQKRGKEVFVRYICDKYIGPFQCDRLARNGYDSLLAHWLNNLLLMYIFLMKK
uniref:Putative secreted protein n=1 Tax=Panstrongylus lignarius TaxID=156445 RepID=A0A224Y3E3_9HEMI